MSRGRYDMEAPNNELQALRSRVAELEAEVWRLEAGLERIHIATAQLLMGGTFEIETEAGKEVEHGLE